MRSLIVALICLLSVGRLAAQDFTIDQKGIPFGGNIIDIEQGAGGALFAVASGAGLYKSTDNGTSWTKIPTADVVKDIDIDANGIIYATTNTLNVYVSNDNTGLTFTNRSIGSFQNRQGIAIKKFGASATSALYVLTNFQGTQSLFRSIDNGVSWTEVFTEIDPSFPVQGMLINSLGNVFLYQTGKGIKKSGTGATAYTLSVTGITNPDNTVYSDNYSGGNFMTYAGSDLLAIFSGALYKSVDNGASWTSATPPGYTEFYKAHISSFGTGAYVANGNAGAVHVYNAGTWTSTAATFKTQNIKKLLAKASNDLYMACDLGVLKSTTGATWTSANQGIEAISYSIAAAQALFTFGDNYYTMSNPMFKSTDNGTTWTNHGLIGSSYSAVTVSPDGTFMSASGNNIARVSNDAGANWSSKTITVGGTELLVSDGTYVYALAEDFITKTNNNGTSWTNLALTGLPSSFIAFPQNIFISSGHMFFSMYVNTRYRFYRANLTTGVTTEIPVPAAATVDSFQPNGLWGYGNKLVLFTKTSSVMQVYTSTDLGVNWTTANTPVLAGATFFVTGYNYWVLVGTGSLKLSRDEGATWLSASNANITTNAKAALIDQQGHLNILVNNKGLFRTTKPMALPAAPTNLKITGSTFNKVRLEWDNNSDNESSFKVERSVGTAGNYNNIADVSVTNQVVKIASLADDVDPGKTYYYRISAVNTAGSSAYSNVISFTAPAKCATTVPNNRSWNVTTLNLSGQGVKTATVPLVLSRLDDYAFGGNGDLGGSNPAWAGNYTVVSSGFLGATVIENCGSVYLSVPTNSNIAPDGNGTWNAVTKKVTIKWKLNEQAVAPATAAPISEVSELVMSNTYPAPVAASAAPFVGVYDDTGIGVGWTSTMTYGTDIAIERATSSGGPFAEVGRVSPPYFFFVDRNTLVSGATYFYRLKAYNPDNPAGVVGPSTTTGVVFTKPYFAGVETQTGYPISTRVAGVWTDVNNDGFDDLFFSGASGITSNEPPTILMNQTNGTFTRKAFLDDIGLSLNHPKFVDFNNDGNVDVLLENDDPTSTGLEIYSGDGTGNFAKVWSGPQSVSRETLVEDFDKDGMLDFLMGTFSTDPANGNQLMGLSVMRNTGNFNFSKTTEVVSPERMALNGIVAVDYDNDSDRDIFMFGQTDALTNNYRMMVNNGDGTYTKKDIPSLATAAPAQTMSVAEWVDVDNDLDFDLLVIFASNIREFFRNNGDGSFTKETVAQSQDTYSTLCLAWADVDNDGDEDMTSSIISGTSSAIHLNNGAGIFTRKQGETATSWIFGRNVYVTSDYNHDGSVDLFIGANDINGRILKGNNFTPANKWISIKLRGVKSNRSAVGASIKVTAGNVSQVKTVTTHASASSGGHHSLVKHFGVGTASTVDIEVTWPSGKKQKLQGIAVNQFFEIIEDTDGPTIASSTPAHNAVDVNATTQISFTMDESFTITNGKVIDVVNTAAPATSLFSVNASSGVKNDKTVTYTLPGKLPPGVDISVIIPEGSFVDNFGTGNAAVAINTWKFKTNKGPLIVTRKPDHAAIGIATNTSLEITFDKSVVAVAGKIVHVKDGAAVLANLDVAAGTVAGDKFTLPTGIILPASKLIEITIDAGAFIDNNTDKNDFGGIGAGAWTFTTGAPLDLVKPTITFNPTPYQELTAGFSPISATVVAEDNIKVTSVTLFSRKSSESVFTPTVATEGTGGNWIVQISNSLQDDMGFEYYIEGKDAAQNKGRSPLIETQFHQSKTKIAPTSIVVNSGGTKQSWKIISIPYDLPSDDRQISSIFSALGGAGRETWRLLHYTNTPAEAWLEYPGFTSVERGKGYFINSIDGGTVTLSNATSPAYTRTNLFSRDLVQGWNQIGNPYSVAINWDNIKAYNNNPNIGALVLFNNGSYSAGNVLPPNQGGFVFMNAPGTVKFSFPGQTIAGGRTSGTQNGPIDSRNWLVDMKLTAGDLTSDLGGFGMNEYAHGSYDEYDGVNAPRFFEYLEVTFPHPEHFMNKFARDVIPTGDEHVWEFNVQNSREEMTILSWDNSMFGAGTKELYLYDVDAQIPIDMRQASSYSFGTRGGRRFRIYFGEGVISKIVPEKALLGAAFPNPTYGFATIPFSLPENNGTLAVRLEVFDMLGRKVATLLQGDMKPGFYQTDWLPGEAANSNGFYIYRLTVGDGAAGEVLSGKILLKR